MYERNEAEQVGRQAHEDLVTCDRCKELEQDADARSTPDGATLCRTCAATPAMCRGCAQVYTLADLTEDGRCGDCPAAPSRDDERDDARSLGL